LGNQRKEEGTLQDPKDSEGRKEERPQGAKVILDLLKPRRSKYRGGGKTIHRARKKESGGRGGFGRWKTDCTHQNLKKEVTKLPSYRKRK